MSGEIFLMLLLLPIMSIFWSYFFVIACLGEQKNNTAA